MVFPLFLQVFYTHEGDIITPPKRSFFLLHTTVLPRKICVRDGFETNSSIEDLQKA